MVRLADHDSSHDIRLADHDISFGIISDPKIVKATKIKISN